MKNSSVLRTTIIVLVLVAIIGISKQNSDDPVDNIKESDLFAANPNWSQQTPIIKFVENNNYKVMIKAEDFNYTNMTISINTTYITNISTDGDIMNIHIR